MESAGVGRVNLSRSDELLIRGFARQPITRSLPVSRAESCRLSGSKGSAVERAERGETDGSRMPGRAQQRV